MRKFLHTLGSAKKRLFPGSETSAAKAARPRSRLQRFEQLEQRTLLSITSEGLATLNIDLADSLETAYDLYTPDAPDLDSASDTGMSSTDNITSDNTPTFTGLVPPGSYVALYEGDVLLGSQQLAVEVEAYAITSSQLADGAHEITVKVAASAEAPEHKVSPALEVTIDTTAPTVAIDEVQNRDSAIGSIDFTFNEAVAGVDISDLVLTLNGGKNLLGDGHGATTTDQLIYTLGGLSDLTAEPGAYTLSVSETITDIAGNLLAAGGQQAWNQYRALLQGTPGNDTITFTTGVEHTVTINKTNVYQYNPAVVTEIHIDAGDGNDTITITGSEGSDTATLSAGSVEVEGPAGASYHLSATSVETIRVHSGGGSDAATLTGSPGIDYLNAYPERCLMYNGERSYRNEVHGFASVTVDVSGTETPGDSAYIRDSPFDDLFITNGEHATMNYGGDARDNIIAIGFKNVLAYSENGGDDAAMLTGSAGLDEFYGFADKSYLRVDGRTYFHYAAGFSRVDATAGTGGNDIARFYDSTGDDTLTVGPETVAMDYDPEVLDLAVTATGFQRVRAYSQNGGDDIANLSGSAGDDRFVARPESFYISLAGGKSNAQINGFKQVTVDVSPAEPGADSGADYAYVYDSPESDVLTAGPAEAAMDYGANTLIDVAMLGFDRLYAYSENGGFDEATLTGSTGIDSLNADPDRCLMYHAERAYRTDVRGFAVVTVDVSSAETPADSAYIRDSPFDDLFITNGEHATMNYGGDARDNIIAIGFKNVLAYSENGGDDAAMLTGSAGLDEFYGFADKSYLRVDGRTYFHYAAGFSSVEATGANLGNDIARLYGSASPTGDRFTASPERAAIDFGNTGADDVACDGFRRVYADFSSGGGFNELWLTDSIGKDRFTGSGDSGSLTDGSRYWINFHGLGPDDMVWLLSVDEGNTMKKENVDYLLEYFPDFWDEF